MADELTHRPTKLTLTPSPAVLVVAAMFGAAACSSDVNGRAETSGRSVAEVLRDRADELRDGRIRPARPTIAQDEPRPFDPSPEPHGCTEAPPLVGGGSSGPVNLVEEQGHGLPGCYRCGLAKGDFDGDGREDVVMAGAFDSAYTANMGSYVFADVIRVYENVSCPGQELRFQLQQEVPGAVGGGGAIVVAGDFDGDGRRDFAVQFREGDRGRSDTSAYLNRGGWSFERSVLGGGFDTASSSLGMAAADLDQDGRDDLALISDAGGAAPGLWYRYVSGGWEARQTGFTHRITYGGTIAAGDLNGDGWPDLAVGGNASLPFGNYDCGSTLMYGQTHFNRGAAGIDPSAADALGRFALRNDRSSNPATCTGSDNAGMMITDVDCDGHQDIILAGSSDGFRGPPGLNGSQYDFVVLRNVDGTGRNFVTFENAGEQYPGGTTNGGTGSVDFPNIAVGDLTGDGYPEIFTQGHHRDYAVPPGARYVFDTRLFLSVAGATDFQEVEVGLPDVGEGGQLMADFNLDGKVDLVFAGATRPWHSNGQNYLDENDASTLYAGVWRNVRP
ncbi:VCBS repeat-containing protein [Myxococcota bacterium]|nr:VCBS repeat-containing protein [Myxococcota bacterium]